MPGRDRTGPQGRGVMTGWGGGHCGGERGAGDGNFGGRGWNCRGGGRGRRNMAGQPGWRRAGWDYKPTPEQEALELKFHAAGLEDELKRVRQRLDEVEKNDKAE